MWTLDAIWLVNNQDMYELIFIFVASSGQNGINATKTEPVSHDSLHTCQRSYIPGDIVAPTNGLHPVDGAGVEPHQVTWSLDEPIDGHVGLVQVLQVGPPRAHQKVDVVSSGEEEKESGDGCMNKGKREGVTGRQHK